MERASKITIGVALGGLLLSGCASSRHGSGPTVLRQVRPPAATAPARTMAPIASDPCVTRRGRGSGEALIRQAVANGTFVPDPKDYIGSTYTPPYIKDCVYRVYAAAGVTGRQQPKMTEIELQEGEIPFGVPAPDKVVWKIWTSYYGVGARRVYKVNVAPKVAGVEARIAIDTDRRSYPIVLVSRKYDRHDKVRFTYPQDDLRRWQMQEARRAAGETSPADAILPRCVNERYAIEADSVDWAPQASPDGAPAVCDDGERMRISFPADLGAVSGPTVFEADEPDGDTHLSNWVVVGSNYVVDGTPAVIVLREGAGKVVIRREGR